MNSYLNVNATAVTNLTGEGFRSACNRLAGHRAWTNLVVSAGHDQSLLEALILGALALYRKPQHPFGVLEAFRAESNLLHVRLESAKAVESLLDLLPYAEKRGTRRGIPGMRASMVGKQLELTASFGDKTGIRWSAVDPKVHIHLQGETPLAVVLQKHYDRVVQERCTPHWVPGETVAQPRRRPPLSRDVIAQHRASAQMASALLRRPRMWTALVGHDGLTVTSAVSDHGLNWTLMRTVSTGAALHDERLVELLQDTVTGPDLLLLDHTCEPETCTLRFVRFGERADGWRGILTVRTEHGNSAVGSPGRALAALGEERPSRHSAPRTRGGARPEPSRCFVLTSGPSSREAVHDLTEPTAIRLVTAWAAEGHVTAVLTINDADFSFDWYSSRSRHWPKAAVPGPTSHVVRWSRLRLMPGNGEAWKTSLNPSDGIFASVEDEAIDAAIEAALERCTRVLVLDQRGSAWAGGLRNKGIDGVIFAFGASNYPRTTTTPAWRRAVDGDRTKFLAPDDSAALWRELHLGQHDLPRISLVGIVPLRKRKEDTPSDAYSEQVEDQLRRYGTPVLGWLPPEPGEQRPLHVNATKTALDEMSSADRAGEIAAASAIGSKLW